MVQLSFYPELTAKSVMLMTNYYDNEAIVG